MTIPIDHKRLSRLHRAFSDVIARDIKKHPLNGSDESIALVLAMAQVMAQYMAFHKTPLDRAIAISAMAATILEDSNRIADAMTDKGKRQ